MNANCSKKEIKAKDRKLASVLKELKEKKLLSSDQLNLLNLNFDQDTVTIIENELPPFFSREPLTYTLKHIKRRK